MKRPILIATAALLTCTPVPAVALQIFVSSEKDNTVTVIEGKTLEVIKTIPTSSPAPTARKSMSPRAMATSWM